MKAIFLSASAALVLASAPAQAMTPQDAAAQQIVVTGKYKKDWEKGSKLEAEGLKELEKAKRDLVDASADVVNAQNMRDSSHDRAENARTTFEKLIAYPLFSDPHEAKAWAKRVENAASDWARYHDRRADGRKQLDKAQKHQSGAQEAVEKAQAKIDKGRALMIEAQRASLQPGG